MSIFGNQSKMPTRINEVQMNQSILGLAVPVVMGCGKIQQSIAWTDGFTAKTVNTSGGKGFGGGKGGSQFVYSADVIAALCAGPVVGVGDVWSGQSWLRNTWANETYLIGSGASYTPVNASNMTGDGGVSVSQGYTHATSDLGQSTGTLTGTMSTPLKRVAYGTTLTTGTYSVSPANVYNFATADIGRTVTLSYSFALSTISKQEIVLIPSGRNFAVPGNLPFSADEGVRYYDTLANNGLPLTRVSGTPTVTGTYSVDSGSYSVSTSGGTTTVTVIRAASYTFAPGDVAAEVQITYSLDNSSALPAGTQTSLSFQLYEGYLGQSPWSLLSSNFPGAALGYSGIAFAAYGPMDLGYGGQIQQNVFEVFTPDMWGGGIVDCSPVQCILQMLTNSVWGLGTGNVPFPVSALDNGVGGTWGHPGAGQTITDSTATAWFAANSFFISPVIDRQDTAASLMGKWLEAGQCAAFMSEGLLKLVPYGDTTTAGNGAVWVAPSAFACALDDTCFISRDKGKDPVSISSSPWTDAYNTVQVSWRNRGNQYAPEITPESDQAAINRYGTRIEDPQDYEFITTLPAATFAASMRVKRSVYTRNTYEFTLPHIYTFLEDMDVVVITTSSAWAAGLNNTNLAVYNLAVRITRITDNPDGTLDITAEDYPFGANCPVIYNKGVGSGAPPANQYADPGDTTAVVFNTTARLTAYTGAEIWMGAAGANAAWGGCNVLASRDGVTYVQIGEINSQARLGTLAAALPLGTDPDTTDTMVVNLVANSTPLEAGTTLDADNDSTLCFVDGELISYSACNITGANQFTAGTYLRRGQMGSVPLAHSIGGAFLRLDSAVFRYTFDPTWAGQTVLLKFQSFNVYGNSLQSLSALTPMSFVVAPTPVNTINVTGTTPNPALSFTALTDLPELGAANPLMSVQSDGSHPVQINLTLRFNAGTPGSSGGSVSSIGYLPNAYSPGTSGGGLPTINISISGDGSGASANVLWAATGWYPSMVFTPSINLVGGSGYTHATATVVVTGAPSGGPFSNGTTTYSCTISTATSGSPTANAPIEVTVLEDGYYLIGPVQILTDNAGNAFFTNSISITPTFGSHSYQVQAWNKSTSNAVSTSRSFQLVPIG